MEQIVIANKEDVNTYANLQEIIQEHMILKATIDFDKQILTGSIEIRFKIMKKEITYVVLDMKKVDVHSVSITQFPNEPIHYDLFLTNPDKEALGTPMVITLPKDAGKQEKLNIIISFSTTQDSPAVKFLSKEQTLTKQFPFMFTQCEPILCRALFPCQDTPSTKVTCEAQLTVSKGLVALFSGIQANSSENATSITFYYHQKIPIPTYLIAIASGELEYGKLSSRCGVWAEKGLVEKAVYEFESTEKFLTTAENYLTPYEWGVYNILVLPASFPYGGMENPCLTFVTPTLLAGDQSLANVIAHEISHSWTGNLVTNKNWKNFWMNEGFTTFLERKIGELIYGEDFCNLENQVGKAALEENINSIGLEHSFTSLQPNFEHCDPDDGFSRVPYEKGFIFLLYLEYKVGKEKFMKILRAYIQKFKYQSVTYEDFKNVFINETMNDTGKATKEDIEGIKWNEWVNTPGYPLHIKEYSSKLIEQAKDLANDFLNKKTIDKTAIFTLFRSWHTNQKIVFFDNLMESIEKIDNDIYSTLDRVLKLNDTTITYNTEISCSWYMISLKTKHINIIIEGLKNFLSKYGRMKYIRPLFSAWYSVEPNEAKEYFKKVKYFYHPVAARLIEEKLL